MKYKGALKCFFFIPNEERQIDLSHLSEEYGVGGLKSTKLLFLNQKDRSPGALIETYFLPSSFKICATFNLMMEEF